MWFALTRAGARVWSPRAVRYRSPLQPVGRYPPCAVCVSVKCTPDITRADATCLLWSGPSENCGIVVGNDQPCADPACISPDTLTSAAAQSGFNFATTSAMLGRVDACRARTAATRGPGRETGLGNELQGERSVSGRGHASVAAFGGQDSGIVWRTRQWHTPTEGSKGDRKGGRAPAVPSSR